MKKNVDKQIENLVDKVMKQSTLETPSIDFTSHIMVQVEAAKQSTSTTYQPLISKRVWAIISIGFIAFVGYILYVIKPETSDWFNAMDLNSVMFSNIFKGINPPRIVGYSVGLLAMMLLIQIPFLKTYFDKQLAI